MYYVIRSLKMANFLVRAGFDILKVSDSEQDPNFKVFLFNDSKELRNYITMFTQNLSQKSS
jgi:ATP-dependent Clp protease adapter protein ClpS